MADLLADAELALGWTGWQKVLRLSVDLLIQKPNDRVDGNPLRAGFDTMVYYRVQRRENRLQLTVVIVDRTLQFLHSLPKAFVLFFKARDRSLKTKDVLEKLRGPFPTKG
ncbi:MAG: hypothetical protein AB7I79_24220 [Rhizobiaceae bacterium]